MSIIFPVVFFAIPLLVALKLCGWQIVVSFLIAIFVVPFCVVFLSNFTQAVIEKQEFSFKDSLAITAMFAVPGIPIYFLIILPLYYFIQARDINFYIAFPCAVSVIMLFIVKLLENEPQPFWFYLVVISCGIAHSLLIVWLIIKLKALSV